MPETTQNAAIEVLDLGRVRYEDAYQRQLALVDDVLAARQSGKPKCGYLLLLEHDPPVITMTRRPDAAQHLLASTDMLVRQGIEVQDTDRGGDITYHGPGQLVAYPILDLNVLGLNLHAYLRLLEQVAIDSCAAFGLKSERDPEATGVWVARDGTRAKICALGVRVRRWVSFHGIALNVTTNLDHFKLIVPCGLAGRSVTSLARELGSDCPDMDAVKRVLSEAFQHHAEQLQATTRG